MQVETRDPVLTCTLGEFYSVFWKAKPECFTDLEGLTSHLMGETKVSPRFRIPAADNGKDVFFENQELFFRYATMSTPSQGSFLASVRCAMRVKGVRQIEIQIPWSSITKKTLSVRATSDIEGPLDFNLLT